VMLFERGLTMRDTAAFSRALGSTLIFHARGDSAILTRAAVWQMTQPILSAFPDIRFHVEDEV